MPGEAPPPAVVQAFGVAGAAAEPLDGGQGETWRAGAVVLKPFDDREEATWTADVFETLDGPGFRVPRPIRTETGKAWFEGWVAWQYLEAVHAGPNGGRWPETVAACEAFHAASRVFRVQPSSRGRRTRGPWPTGSRSARRRTARRCRSRAWPTACSVSCGRSTCRRS